MQKVGVEPTCPLQTDVSKTPLSTSSITSAVVLPRLPLKAKLVSGREPYLTWIARNLTSVAPFTIKGF